MPREETGKPPIAKVRNGGVTASIWENEQKDFTSYSITLQRSYKDNEGDWKNVNNLRTGDVYDAILSLQEAYKKVKEIRSKEKEKTKSEDEEEEAPRQSKLVKKKRSDEDADYE